MEENRKVEVIQEQNDGKQGMSIASLVLGIIALVFWCAWPISITCSILAVIFGILRMKKMPGKGMAIAGFITGIIALSFWIIFFGLVFMSAAIY